MRQHTSDLTVVDIRASLLATLSSCSEESPASLAGDPTCDWDMMSWCWRSSPCEAADRPQPSPVHLCSLWRPAITRIIGQSQGLGFRARGAVEAPAGLRSQKLSFFFLDLELLTAGPIVGGSKQHRATTTTTTSLLHTTTNTLQTNLASTTLRRRATHPLQDPNAAAVAIVKALEIVRGSLEAVSPSSPAVDAASYAALIASSTHSHFLHSALSVRSRIYQADSHDCRMSLAAPSSSGMVSRTGALAHLHRLRPRTPQSSASC